MNICDCHIDDFFCNRMRRAANAPAGSRMAFLCGRCIGWLSLVVVSTTNIKQFVHIITVLDVRVDLVALRRHKGKCLSKSPWLPLVKRLWSHDFNGAAETRDGV